MKHLHAIFAATLALTASTANAAVIGQWSFGDGSGTTAVDSVGGRNGTLSGNVSWTSSGRNGSTALQFSGGSVLLPSGVLSAVNSTKEITLTMWINMFAYNNYETIWDNPSRQFALWLTSTGGWRGTDGFGGVMTFTPPVSLNTWHFLAVSYKAGPGADFSVYVDNQRVGGGTPSTNSVTFNQAITVGANVSEGGRPFSGMIQDITIYNEALPASVLGTGAVPEPGTIFLLGAGLALCGLAANRNRRNPERNQTL